MDLKQNAIEKCRRYGQEHLMAAAEKLEGESREKLITQILETDFSVLDELKTAGIPAKRGKIEPIPVRTVAQIEEKKEEYRRIGLEAIRDGKVGAVLLAGGMGTRLGYDGPKGSYNLGLTHPVYIFERIISNLLDVVKEAGCWVRLFIMTSDKNDEETRRFLKEHRFFGYDEHYVTFFRQAMAPATDLSGRIFLETPDSLSSAPNGNGGWFVSMQNAGLMDLISEEKIEYLNVFAVDNVLQRIADPVFVGATLEGGYVCGAKVIKKADPDEKVGAMCLEDGRPSIIEYIDFTDEYKAIKDENGECAINYGVILNYLFRVDSLISIAEKKIPVHVVNKKIPYMNEKGETVKPDVINGHKFETLVVDMIHLLENCLPFEVVREKEFAPIKNATGTDSVESARELLRKNNVEL